VPVSSVGLNDQNANNATAAIKIPLRLFKLGDNTITLTSNLQVNKSVQASTLYCTDKYYSDSWLTVSPTSTFTFPSGVGEKTASLAGFPALYLGSAEMSNLALVVPEKPDWATANLVIQSINRLGRTAKGDQLAVAVVPASQQTQVSAQRPYQILVGLPAQNKAIQQLNDLLPQPFESDWVTPKALSGEIAVAPSASGLGYIESLYTKEGQYRLVLTATSANGLSWVASLINTPTSYKEFEGNLAVLTRSDEAAFYKIASQTSLVSDQPAVTATAPTNRYNQFPDWVFWLAIVIFLAAIGSLLVIRVMRNRK
jgi:Bacterial cellulose synthase subunit.